MVSRTTHITFNYSNLSRKLDRFADHFFSIAYLACAVAADDLAAEKYYRVTAESKHVSAQFELVDLLVGREVTDAECSEAGSGTGVSPMRVTRRQRSASMKSMKSAKCSARVRPAEAPPGHALY
jgi:TPR repeat protein